VFLNCCRTHTFRYLPDRFNSLDKEGIIRKGFGMKSNGNTNRYPEGTVNTNLETSKLSKHTRIFSPTIPIAPG